MNHTQKSIQRQRSLAVVVITIAAFIASPSWAATINVGDTCLLTDAITAAESDTATGGCTAGLGADIVTLSSDVTLTTDAGSNGFEPIGLPLISTQITIQGNNHTIERDVSAEAFMMISVAATGVLTLDHVTVSGGSGSNVGGIQNRGHLAIVDSIISNNHGDNVGGVINGNATATDTSLTVIRALFANNDGDGNGGAIFNNAGDAVLRNCTLSGNTSDFGAAFNNSGSFGSKPAATATIDHCTLSGNTSTYSGQILNQGDALLTLIGTLISGDYNCSGNAPPTNGGANFGSDSSCTGTTILTGFDTTLRNNGGSMPTHALLLGSNAIDAGGNCGLGTDARGVIRDSFCDSGSFELNDLVFRDGFDTL